MLITTPIPDSVGVARSALRPRARLCRKLARVGDAAPAAGAFELIERSTLIIASKAWDKGLGGISFAGAVTDSLAGTAAWAGSTGGATEVESLATVVAGEEPTAPVFESMRTASASRRVASPE